MQGDPMLLRRLEAYDAQRAVPSHTHARVRIEPHALVLAALALSGEDASVHAITMGWPGRPAAQLLVVPDPRKRDDAAEMFAWLGSSLERYFAWCDTRGAFPQIVITSDAALRHLTNIAEDYRFLEQSAGVCELARRLTYFTDRAPEAGQQCVVVMTHVLTTHWVTPMQPIQEQHLAAVLACIDPPSGCDLAARIDAAEQIPMGATTDPVFDNTILGPRLRTYDAARRRGDAPEVLAAHRHEVEAALAPVVGRMYEAIQDGLGRFVAAHYPELLSLEVWREQELSAYQRFRVALQQGVRFPLHDRAKQAALRLLGREDAAQNETAAVECEDTFGRARSICLGESLAGMVENPRVVRRGPRAVDTFFDVVTSQRALALRERDTFVLTSDHRLTVVVTGYANDGARNQVTLRVLTGMRAPGAPTTGTSVTFVRARPDWYRAGRQRHAVHERLQTMPWTHVPGTRPGEYPRGVAPANPLAVLEVLR